MWWVDAALAEIPRFAGENARWQVTEAGSLFFSTFFPCSERVVAYAVRERLRVLTSAVALGFAVSLECLAVVSRGRRGATNACWPFRTCWTVDPSGRRGESCIFYVMPSECGEEILFWLWTILLPVGPINIDEDLTCLLFL